MKKKCFVMVACMLCMFGFFTVIYGADLGYDFKLQYEGNIIENQEKSGNVMLTGVNATGYSNVRIKVEVDGPAIPTIFAKDANGKEFDMIKLGYYGPTSGFAVGGTFTNTTPVRVMYPKVGKYTTVISLVDVKNANQTIFSKKIEVNVAAAAIQGPVSSENKPITSLPKTGISFVQSLLFLLIPVVVGVLFGFIWYQKRQENQ